ncbi:MAG: MFS transporter [Hyphomicrobiales bacterium]|nr:MFS transporter [Hyphomicrobiales bacterium]MDE2114782.1 MFS transporter [Hyphomicrobiales bacterium]
MTVQLDGAHANMRQDFMGRKSMAWATFALTFALYIFDFVDRQVITSMLPAIKIDWQLSDTQLGMIISVVMVTVALLAIPVSILADRWSRVKCIAAMALLWCLATIACGYATSYAQLLTMRGLVGVGEAAYGSVGIALLSTLFPAQMRAFLLSAFNAAALLGSMGGVLIGGYIAKTYGWHSAFGVVGFPGLILALMYFLVPDYKTVELQPGVARRSSLKSLAAMMRALLETPSAILIYVCNALQLFVLAAIVSWLPSFLNRSYGLATDVASVRMVMVLIASSLGTIIFGLVADRISRHSPGRKFEALAVSAFLTFVTFAFAFNFMAPGPWQFRVIVLGGLFMGGTLGTTSALTVEVAHPGIRATALAVGALVQNLLGLAAGPAFTGILSDHLGLPVALGIVPFFSLLSAVAFLLVRRVFLRDLARTA